MYAMKTTAILTGRNNAEHRCATFLVEHISDHRIKEGDTHVRVGQALDRISHKDENDDPYCMMTVSQNRMTESKGLLQYDTTRILRHALIHQIVSAYCH